MHHTMTACLRQPQARLLLLVLAVLVCACGGRTEPPKMARLSDEATILAFGDSLTYGSGATTEQSYPARLQALIGRKVINAGIPGETTDAGLQRLPVTLRQADPDLVILCLGGNDMLRRQDRGRMKDNLAAMIGLIRERGVPVILLGVPEPKLIGLSTEQTYLRLAEQFGLALEAEALPEILGDAARRADQIHPNAQGYADLASAVADLLRRSGAI